VLLIVGILLSATLVPLASHRTLAHEREVQSTLSVVRDALIAHLISNEHLPCPIDLHGATTAAGPVDGQCSAFRGGVPARPLSLSGAIDARGALLDPWGRPYRYALSDTDDGQRGTRSVPDWSGIGESAAVGIERLRGSLVICQQAARDCPSEALRATDLVFVVLSSGADAGDDGLQRQNLAARGSFTLAPPSVLPVSRFDDALVWASRSELVWWLLRAARLP